MKLSTRLVKPTNLRLEDKNSGTVTAVCRSAF